MKAYILNNQDLLELSIGDKVTRKNHPYIGDVPKVIETDNEQPCYFWELTKKEKHREGCDKLTFISDDCSFYICIDYKYSLGVGDSYERTDQNIGYSLYSLKEHSIAEKDIYVTCIPSRKVGMDDID